MFHCLGPLTGTPASFGIDHPADKTYPVTCNGKGWSLDVSLGSEQASAVTIDVRDEQKTCVNVAKSNPENSVIKVRLTETRNGLCGASFAVTLVLNSSLTSDVAIFQFTGCPSKSRFIKKGQNFPNKKVFFRKFCPFLKMEKKKSKLFSSCSEVNRSIWNLIPINHVPIIFFAVNSFYSLHFSATDAPIVPPANLLDSLTNYQQSFEPKTDEYFSFNSSTKEIQLRKSPPPDTSFILKFSPKAAASGRTNRQIGTARADDDDPVLTLRTLNYPVMAPVDPSRGVTSKNSLTTSEIVLIVVGSVLLLAIFALIAAFVKLVRYRNAARAAATASDGTRRAPLPNGAKTVAALPVPDIIRQYTPPKSEQGTVRSAFSVASSRPSRGSNRSYDGERVDLNPDPVISNGSTDTDVDLLDENIVQKEQETIEYPPIQPEEEPAPDYPLNDEVVVSLLPPVSQEPELDVEADEPASPEPPSPPPSTTPLPPPPPPPLIILPSSASAPSLDVASPSYVRPVVSERPATLGPSSGQLFMDELKKAVADPYTVLTELKSADINGDVVGAAVPELSVAERKVRFDNMVEVFNSSVPASPASSLKSSSGPRTLAASSPFGSLNRSPLAAKPVVVAAAPVASVYSPSTPVYSARLRNNLERDSSPKNGVLSPPAPTYVAAAAKELMAKSTAGTVASPSPPIYKAMRLTKDETRPAVSFDESVTPTGEIISHRQINREDVSSAPPPPPPPAPPASTSATMETSEQTETTSTANATEATRDEDEVQKGSNVEDEEDRTALWFHTLTFNFCVRSFLFFETCEACISVGHFSWSLIPIFDLINCLILTIFRGQLIRFCCQN